MIRHLRLAARGQEAADERENEEEELEDETGAPLARGAPEEGIIGEANREDLDEETRGPEDKASEARVRGQRGPLEEDNALGATPAPEVCGKSPAEEYKVEC